MDPNAEYTEEEGLLSQVWRTLFSSFELNNITIIIPLLLFYL